MRTYRTVQGDMWDLIAFKELGSGHYTNTLIAANPELREVYIFDAGVTVNIPEVSTAEVKSPAPWRSGKG